MHFFCIFIFLSNRILIVLVMPADLKNTHFCYSCNIMNSQLKGWVSFFIVFVF